MDGETDVLVGVAGWSYEDWKGVVYPPGERDKLSYMARYVNCIEINSSFYRPFPPRYAGKWLRDVSANDAFRFTAKLWRGFTHEMDKEYPASEVRAVKEGLGVLHESKRLVGVLAQFPFYFQDSSESRERLRRIAGDFAQFPLALEVRDSSWATPEALGFVEAQGFSLACLDMPLAANSFREKTAVTGPLGYLRLHGRNYDAWFSKNAGRDERYNYLYEPDELDFTLERIKKLQEMTRRVVVIWNNHYRGKAMVNALETVSHLRGTQVETPPLLLDAYPRLKRIARRKGDGLFER